MLTIIKTQLFVMPGAKEALAALLGQGYQLAIISGTLDLVLEHFFPDHPFQSVFTNRIWFDAQEHIEGWEATPYDMEGKARALRSIAAQVNIGMDETVFVGDHLNDLEAMKAAGMSVAVEPKDPRVAEVADEVIQGDLHQLIPLLCS
jgi:HAD superfamily phosphoserine phosphatase-like hydrolase